MSLFRYDSPHASSIAEKLLKRAVCPSCLTFLPSCSFKQKTKTTVAVILLADPSLPEWMRNSVLYLSYSLSCIWQVALETLSSSGISATTSRPLSMPCHHMNSSFPDSSTGSSFSARPLLERQPGLSPLPLRGPHLHLFLIHPYAVLQCRLSSICWWLLNPYL